VENCRKREEIKACWKSFFNSSEEKEQRSEFRRREKQFICSQNRRSINLPVDRHAQHGA